MENQDQNKPRKRSITELTLGWIADRLRKSEDIKAKIQAGTYSVDTEKVAASLVNAQPEK